MAGFVKWMNAKTKKLDWKDIAFTKIAVMGFTLTVAKLWTPILSLYWYWYALIWIVFAIKPLTAFFKK
ncbi:MAG: hypothetical protein PHT91_00130 [Candidatus Nanoarchaeia archaeon]|nr:hypothetical protein [Candidatus Nanoarchaeia archaeon]